MKKGLRNKIWWAKDRQLMRHFKEWQKLVDKEFEIIKKIDFTSGFLDRYFRTESFKKNQELNDLKVFINNLYLELGSKK